MFSDSTHSNAAQCFFSKASTETFDWEQAYLEDPETVTVMQLLLNCHDKPSFTDEQLQTVSVSYKTALKDNRIQLVNGKLVLFVSFWHFVGLCLLLLYMLRYVYLLLHNSCL